MGNCQVLFPLGSVLRMVQQADLEGHTEQSQYKKGPEGKKNQNKFKYLDCQCKCKHFVLYGFDNFHILFQSLPNKVTFSNLNFEN